VVECPEAAVAFVDDGVPARSSAWIDAQNSHAKRLGATSDVSCEPLEQWGTATR
jgi:hypothetical protein